MLTLFSFQIGFITRFGAILFLSGKIVRFLFYLFFLYFLVSATKVLASYTLAQTLMFYLTFNLVDTMSQLFLREIYRFRPMVLSGQFDLILAKPINPLFRVLLGGADLFDLLVLLFLLVTMIFLISKFAIVISIFNLFFYWLLLICSLVMALAFHILVASLAITTSEIDHSIMIYRDITSMGRIPVDFYAEPIKSLLTFVLPVGVMMTFPAKAMLGLLSWQGGVYAIFLSGLLFFLSFKFWNFSLKKYTSASS